MDPKTQVWKANNVFHRVGGPAHIVDIGERKEEWYHHGKRHRLGGPAVIWSKDGTLTRSVWFKNGETHRTGGPSTYILEDNGKIIVQWSKNNIVHRTRGPAEYTMNNGVETFKWVVNGYIHNITGPAIITFKDGVKINAEWMRNGRPYDHHDTKQYLKEHEIYELYRLSELMVALPNDEEELQTVVLPPGVNERYLHLNNYTNDDPSGVKINNGTWSKGNNKIVFHENQELWYLDNKLHRIYGPAKQEWDRKIKKLEEWYIDGVLHRLDGPALQEWNNGQKITVKWYRNGLLHRDSDPAYWVRDYTTSTIGWFIDGKPHREDGPTFISFDYLRHNTSDFIVEEQWNINGKYVYKKWRSSGKEFQ